ncbi:DUF262 domain-containing protein [Brevundimonas naejangsanensis]|uniref:DUF262 domain-containing protein n=1 Tax=Brevundimonas naejangsanensis TaxID=588932 RepID=UPI00320AC555
MIDEARDEAFEDEDQQEDEEDLSVSAEDFDELLVAPSDWTVGSLHQQIGGQIDLDPKFQRRSVWNNRAKSSFIESIFLNIPIPQILLAARKNRRNSYIVLDGKQRLLTIQQFINGRFDNGRPFRLFGLRILKEIEGKTWDQIQQIPDWRDRFLNTTQRTTVLRGYKSESALYEIFYRLNSGSVKLSPMELRMSLYPGPFLKFIIEWTETIRPVHTLLNLTKPDKRMADVELTARHLAFLDPQVKYFGNLKKFIDDVCVDYNEKFQDPDFADTMNERLINFNDAITAAIDIFGNKHVCRKYKEGKYDRLFNRAVFDVIVGSLANEQARDWAIHNKDAFEQAYITLSSDDPKFVNSVESTTKSIESTKYRFTAWYDKFFEVSNIRLATPNIA